MRQVLVHPGEDGFWVAECPSLPGCVSQGESREQAITNTREAIEGYSLAPQDDRLPVPPEHFDALVMPVGAGCFLKRGGKFVSPMPEAHVVS